MYYAKLHTTLWRIDEQRGPPKEDAHTPLTQFVLFTITLINHTELYIYQKLLNRMLNFDLFSKLVTLGMVFYPNAVKYHRASAPNQHPNYERKMI